MSTVTRRAAGALRVGLLGGTAIVLIGITDHFTTWPLLTATLGPTAYLLLSHPEQESSRLRNAVIGHCCGVGAGCAGLWLTGSWAVGDSFLYHSTTLRHAFAAAIAVAITLFVLTVTNLHHAPAGASAVLVSTGLAEPGQLLAGLGMGLVGLFLLVMLMNRLAGSPPPQRGDEALEATGRAVQPRQGVPR